MQKPFEALAISGKASKEGAKSRTDQNKKATFQEWIVENKEKVKNCTKINDLRKIDYIKAIPVADGTIKKWFKEVYPNQLKSGRPKKL